MDLIFEQAKQYFIGKDYLKANKLIEDNKGVILESKLPLAYDIQACALFMNQDYEAAIKFYDLAIQLNPKIADFYISKGAALRCLGKEDQAIEVFEKANAMVTDPAIYYNLRNVSRNNQEIMAQTELISQNQQINMDYDKFGGAVPAFLKLDSARSDYIYQRQNQLIKQIVLPIAKTQQWPQHLKKITQMLQFRQTLKTNYGVQFELQNKQLLQAIKQILNLKNSIQQNLVVKIEKQELLNKLYRLLTSIKTQPSQAKQIVEKQINDLRKQYILKSQKQINIYKNRQAFQEAKKQIECIFQKIYNLQNSQNSETSHIHIALTDKNCLIYLNIDFIRSLTPLKSLHILKTLPIQQSKLLFNLYWVICLRVLFNHQQGINIDQYLLLRRGFQFIYYQIDECEEFQIPTHQFTNSLVTIFQKYNQIFQQALLTKQKRLIIYQNCSHFKEYLSQIDENFESILKKKQYINQITKFGDNEYEIFFRNRFKLGQGLIDNLVQDLTLIFFQFRDSCKLTHHLLIKAFAQLIIQTKDTMNGKDSFFENYYNSTHAPLSLIQKIWKKISE